MIKRNIEFVIEDTIKHYPITLLTGPRAIGKYTLLYNAFINKGYSYVSLDDSLELSVAIIDPKTFLEMHPTPLIIDEAQKAPELFPELEKIVWSISQNSVLYLLNELPSAKNISECNLKHLTNLLQKHSCGKYSRDKAIEIRDLAKISIGTHSPSISFELRQVIQTILFLQSQIDDIDKELKRLVVELDSPILSIPGISYVTAAFILAEIGDINNFDSPSKLQAFAGLDPSTYQSGKFNATHSVMVKRGSKYLRWALLTATRLVCMRDKNFNDYKKQKLAEGKHYFVALSHTTKKLIRVIYHLLKTNTTYQFQKVA